jgi:hypothetical protein
MKIPVIIFLLAASAAAYSQTETPKDSFPPLKKESLKLNERRDNYLQFNSSDAEQSKTRESLYYPATNDNTKDKSPQLNFPPLDVYLGPPLESNTFTAYPFANDYSFRSGYAISNGMWLSSSSSYSTYPLIGATRDVGINFNWRPIDWLAVSAGPYGAKYNLFGATYNDVGVSGAVKFILTDRIRLNGYGQYSANGNRNGVAGPLMNMYPQTYYGGTIEVKITRNFGVEGGVIRELNPFSGKWVNRPYIAPVFYTK